ncbi:hypothetical protein [Pyruvatibacter mobilis]|uniref:SLAC1 family transporter n=1 Tax=Pyruvatibacter mobilis TaxID=1712261 RepID=UPI003D147556
METGLGGPAAGGGGLVVDALCWLAVAVTALIWAGYGLKMLRHRVLFLADLRDAGTAPYLGTVPMTLMLLPLAAPVAGAGLPVWPAVWLAGAVLHPAVAVVMGHWLVRRMPRAVPLTPAWFVPIAGMFAAPAAGVPLGYPTLSAMLLAVGTGAWLLLLLPVARSLRRFSRHERSSGFWPGTLPVTLVPSLFVLAAPPALVTRGLWAFGVWAEVQAVLTVLACLTALAVLGYVLWRRQDIAADMRRFGFSPRWWAMSFPLAASASAAVTLHSMGGTVWTALGALAMMALASTAIAILCVATAAWLIRPPRGRQQP